jgi:hypothetical protein
VGMSDGTRSAKVRAALHKRPLPEPGRPIVQRAALITSPLVQDVPPIVHEVLRSPGQPLDAQARAFFEPRFGHDFSTVRIHTDTAAAESARAVNAQAYTVGREVVFAQGRYAPTTGPGRSLLAHELTHAVQQPLYLADPPSELVVACNDDSLEASARQAYAEVLSDSAQPVSMSARPLSALVGRAVALCRQPAPGGPGSAAPPVQRIVYIDANVIDQINRGNASAAKALRDILGSGGEVRVPMRAYSELVKQPEIPRTAEANRLLLEELGVRQGPPGALAERIGTYEASITRLRGGGTVVSQADAEVIAEAKAGGGELWSFDRAVRTSPRNIEASFDIRVAPESRLPLAPHGRPADYRVGRRLLGLPPVTISLSGAVARGAPAPGGGGAAPPRSGAPRATTTSPAPTTATPAGSGGTTAVVGTQDMRPIQVGGPSARGVAIGAGITIAFMGLNLILNWVNDVVQARRVRAALDAMEAGLARTRTEHPSLGILLIFYYTQQEAPPESLIRPGAVFQHIEMATGRTRDEAEEQWQSKPAVRQGPGPQALIRTQLVWIPPIRPASVAVVRTPFRAVAVGTFVAGRAQLQDVEWNGLSGFDDEGKTTLRLSEGLTPRFLILGLPKEFHWFYIVWHTSSLPLQERPAAEGGNVPVVALDPSMPFWNVAAAFVFPADDATDALFDTAPPTRDNLRHIRYVNFSRGRWVRPENTKVLRRM